MRISSWILIFYDIVWMSFICVQIKDVYLIFTQFLIFSLNVLVLVRSFQFRCSCLSVTWSSFYYFCGNYLPSVLLCSLSNASTSSFEPVIFETLHPVFHPFFVLIYWDFPQIFQLVSQLFPCFKKDCLFYLLWAM